MIFKNSGNDLDWISASGEKTFQRETVGQSAISSFEAEVVKMAHNMQSQGLSNADIASKFNYTEEFLVSLLNKFKTTKTASCSCEKEEMSTDNPEAYYKLAEQKKLSEASEAYDAMYGKKQATVRDIPVAHSKSVMSARTENITNEGGPTKQIRSQSSNTILNPDAIGDMMKVKGNDEMLKEEKALRIAHKEKMKYDSRYTNADGKSIVDYATSSDKTKGISVQSVSGSIDTNSTNASYFRRLPAGSISMFDDNTDFDRVPDRTDGERLADKKASKKERGWINDGRVTKTQDVVDAMIKSMLEGK